MGHDFEYRDVPQILDQASQAFRSRDLARARRLAYMAASLDPTIELAWLILAATASPEGSIFYLNKALELNPNSESAQKGMQWAVRRLDRLRQVPAAPVEIPESKESASEITRPIAIHRQPQSKLKQLLGWAQRTSRNVPSMIQSSTFQRVANYTGVHVLTLSLTIIASIFLIIYIANLGGYLDTIQKGLIDENINGMLASGWLKGDSQEERNVAIEQTRASMQAFYGLDQPLAVRSLNWFTRAITFNWGKSRFSYVISSTYWGNEQTRDILSDDIKTIVESYLPRTLILLGASNLGIFLISILIALPLARRPNTKTDRLIRLLSLTSSIPSWVFGLVLLAIFYFVFKEFSFGLGFTGWPSTFQVSQIPMILKGLFLPFLAIFLSKFFQSIYSWRTYFLIYSKEDYIELARAKGLPGSVLERRYLLRPALPAIITSFALIVISIWQECIAVEYFFNVIGVGGLFVEALNTNDLMIVVALVTTFAFFLAITVLILDVVYAIVDPRVNIGEKKQSAKPAGERFKIRFPFRARQEPATTSHAQFPSWPSLAQPVPVRRRLDLFGQLKLFFQRIKGEGYSLGATLREIMHYPTAVFGIAIIGVLICVAIVTAIAIPYSKAISLWRGDDKVWIRNPREVPPEWTNFFRQEKLPVSVKMNSRDNPSTKTTTSISDETTNVSISFPFDYNYNSYPQDVLILFNTSFKVKNPFVILTWVTPDGREIRLKNFAVSDESYNLFSKDSDIVRRSGGGIPAETLFTKSGASPGEVLKGRYEVKVNGVLFEEGSQLDAELVVYGQVYGIAGTDLYRRDLSLILSWGLVVALGFGIIAAIGTTLSSLMLAAAGAWFGGWVDGLIQRISEIMMVLPILPTSIMIFILYSKSIWVILGVTIAMSIFGTSIKNYRAMFLQVIESPYIEAARSYGASGWRIIFQYMIPRVRHVLIPQLIILVPSYVFFESTLEFLGVSDPVTPTLGKLMVTTLESGILTKPAYLTLEPFALILLICLGFALLGFGLERFFNEKLGI